MSKLFAFASVLSLALLLAGCDKKSESKSDNGGGGAGLGAQGGAGGGDPGGAGGGDPGGAEMQADTGDPGGAEDQANAGAPGGAGEGAPGGFTVDNGGGANDPTAGGMGGTLSPMGFPMEGAEGGNSTPMGDPTAGATGGTLSPMGGAGGEFSTPMGDPTAGATGGTLSPMGAPLTPETARGAFNQEGTDPTQGLGAPGFEGGGAGGGGSQPPQYPAGSAEYAVIKLVMDLKAGKVKEFDKVISPRARGLMKELRGGKPSATALSKAKTLLGQVSLFRGRKNALQKANGEHVFVLQNDKNQILQFKCRKEKGRYLIRDMVIAKPPRGRRRR